MILATVDLQVTSMTFRQAKAYSQILENIVLL